ncbi:hypothetical protein MP638_005591 [Amoeboaphelidium occidentale]|nr:hypothetical protein MP638_005591 [Amoeboaphelidium occidentale]
MTGRVEWDEKAIKIDGKRVILNVGHVHYPRSTPSMWAHILDASVAAGINAIDTYVFWNYHEIEKENGKIEYDFSELVNFLRFISERYENKLYVVLRIGPYVCAEWNYGGLPTRLKFMENMEFRTLNSAFMAEMESFTRRVVDATEKYFYTRQGSVILLQIENEYGNIQHDYGYKGQEYINWAVDMAMSVTGELPWFVCQQKLNVPVVINTCNGFYCHEWIERKVFPYSKQPAMFTENWTGWFARWGDVWPRRPVEDLAYGVALWYAHGGTYNAYYMWHGGTNFGRWAGGPQGNQIGPGFITSYDYDAPLNEYGYPHEPKYSQLKRLNNLLLRYENHLLYGEKTVYKYQNKEKIEYELKEMKSKLVFVINSNTTEAVSFEVEGSKYDIPRWSVSVFICEGSCKFLYNTAKIDDLPSNTVVYDPTENFPVKIDFVAESLAYLREISLTGGTGYYRPREQLSLTKDKTDYLSYFLNVKFVDAVPGRDIEIEFKEISDYFQLYWNDELIESRIGGRELKVTIPQAVLKSENHISIITQTMGLTNYGANLERWERGITDQVILNNRDVSNLEHGEWTHFIGFTGERTPALYDPASSSNEWKSITKLKQKPGFVWYKLQFPSLERIEPKDMAYVLKLSSMKKGYCWVNGFNIGRYWMIKTKIPKEGSNGENEIVEFGPDGKCDYAGVFSPGKCRDRPEGEWSQEFYHVPIEHLHFNKPNTIILFEELPGADPSKVQFFTAKVKET